MHLEICFAARRKQKCTYLREMGKLCGPMTKGITRERYVATCVPNVEYRHKNSLEIRVARSFLLSEIRN